MLATGYRAEAPAFLDPVRDRIAWDARGRFDVAADYTVDLAGARDLRAERRAAHPRLRRPRPGHGRLPQLVIIAAMLGREVYPVETRIAFQEFGVPGPTCGMRAVAR